MKYLCSFIALVIIGIVFYINTSAAYINPESFYQEKFCTSISGQKEVVLLDGTRADCETQDTVWEIDYATKWYEGLGQAMHYARLTGKTGGVLLIIEKDSDMTYLLRLSNTISYHQVKVKIDFIRP